MKPRGLGKGLGSLIPNKINPPEKIAQSNDTTSKKMHEVGERVMQISVTAIKANPYQPRHHFAEQELQDLMSSIKKHGILQPLVVTAVEGEEGQYELIAGERRLRASQALGLKTVPAIVKKADNETKLAWALIENIQRHNLNAVEEAKAYKQLLDEYHLTQEEVAERVGKGRSVVANALRLLELPDEIQQAIVDRRISAGHAKALAGLPTLEEQKKLFHKIMSLGMNVRDTEKEVKEVVVNKHIRKVQFDPTIQAYEDQLQSQLGTKVSIAKKKKGGSIVIDFFSDEEMHSLVNQLAGADEFHI